MSAKQANWIKLLIKGEPEAYREFLNKYSKRIYGLARNFGLDHDQSEDIVQETTIVIWERRNFLDPDQNVDAYIRVVARNQILSSLRGKALKVARNYLKDNDSVCFPEIDSKLNAENIEQFIAQTVNGLSPQSRKIYELSRHHGLTHAEIAKDLNISQRTVENQIYRTLKKLKTILSHQELMVLVFTLYF